MAVEERCTRLIIIATLAVLTAIPNAAGQACQNVQLSASITAENFTSPNYPNNYSSSADCQWTITTSSSTAVVVLKLLDFSLENSTNCISDYVRIYDGSNTSFHTMYTLCGVNASTEFTSTGTSLTVVFHSDWVTNFTDFTFEYTSREKSALCGSGALTAYGSATQLTSPGYPYNDSGIINCQWTISANSSQDLVVMNLLDLSLMYTYRCIHDYLAVYDGSSTSSPMIDAFCGDYSIRQFISTGPSLTVLFHAESHRYLRGFVVEYTSQNKSDLCPRSDLQATSDVKYIISPGYPYNYTSDLYCQWTITADSLWRVIVLNFVDIYLESSYSTCIYDTVTISDGPSADSTVIETVCGRGSNIQFISTGSSVTVIFNSDESFNYKGFKLEYTSNMKSDVCTDSSLTATATVQYLTSLSYPYNYQDNMDCQWTITSDSSSDIVVLNMLDFHLEGTPPCIYDYVTIYDGRTILDPIITTLCGISSNRQFSSTGTFMTVVFYSDISNNNRGFSFQYSSQDKSVGCSNATLIATATPKYLTSPGYPNNYASNSDCQWTITAFSSSQVVVLYLVDFWLEGTSPSCTFDYVTIHDGSYSYSSQIQRVCGSQTGISIISSGSTMTIVFQSDESNNFRGFKLRYSSEEASAACLSVGLSASTNSHYLLSPNYPGHYPSNIDCQWTLIASSTSYVVLDLINFDVQGYGSSCLNDYVKIYDGRSIYSSEIKYLCGTEYSGTYESSGSFMTVIFHSDGGINDHTGFQFSYWSKSKSADPLSSGAIAAIVICSIGVPCLIVASIIIYRRRKAQRRPVVRAPVQGGGTTLPTMVYVVNPQQAALYTGMQNPQIATTETPVSYPPPTYSYAVSAGTVPPGQTPIPNEPS